jgi:hypothetical protein
MRRLTFLAIFALVASFILVPAALAQEEVPEIVEEQVEDPQESQAENVAEGQQEAAFEEQIEAQQGFDLTPRQEAALEPQAELQGVEPEAAAAQPKEEPKMMEEKGKEKMKEMPKTGGPGIGMLLPASVLLLGSGILAFAVVRRRG